MSKVLLIFGTMTSGKTTLGEELVKNGYFDVTIEVDDFRKAAFGENLKLGKMWIDDPERAKKLVDKQNLLAGITVAALVKAGFTVAVSGIWPGSHERIMERLQDYSVVLLNHFDLPLVRKRWIDRKNCETEKCRQKVADDFDAAVWGAPEYYVELEQRFYKFGLEMAKKNKILSDLDEFSKLPLTWPLITSEMALAGLDNDTPEDKE